MLRPAQGEMSVSQLAKWDEEKITTTWSEGLVDGSVAEAAA
jgi:hypothetical protein